jgi:hypothetical protein
MDAVLAMPSVPAQPARLRARARAAAGGIAYWRSRPTETHRHYAEALELARATGDRALLAGALYDAGFAPKPGITSQGERMRLGQPFWEEALGLYRELGDEAGVASVLWALSMSAAAHGNLDQGRVYASESLEMSRRRGDRFRGGWAAHMVGLASLTGGHLDEAASLFSESLETWVEAGDRSGITLLLFDVARLARERGAAERRWRLLGAADRQRMETGIDLVNEQVDFLGWEPDGDPRPGDESGWFEEGKRMSIEEAVELAREEIRAG